MSTNRKSSKIVLVQDLFEKNGFVYYELALDDDTQFMLDASSFARPKYGDILSWDVDGLNCVNVKLNGRAVEPNGENIKRAKKILSACTPFAQWITINKLGVDKEMLFLKQEILAALGGESIDVEYFLRRRIPETVICAVIEVSKAPRKFASTVLKAWAQYKDAFGLEDPSEDGS